MNEQYGKGIGHFLMAFGLAAFGERPEDDTTRAADQTEPYGTSPGAEALKRAPTEAPKRACCLARRKVSPLRKLKR
jgi:hypothetical protein